MLTKVGQLKLELMLQLQKQLHNYFCISLVVCNQDTLTAKGDNYSAQIALKCAHPMNHHTTKYSCMMRVKDSRLKHCGQNHLDFLTPDVAIFVSDSISEKFQLMQCTSIFLCDIKRCDNFCKHNTENNQTSCIHTQTKARHGANPVFLRLYGRFQCWGLNGHCRWAADKRVFLGSQPLAVGIQFLLIQHPVSPMRPGLQETILNLKQQFQILMIVLYGT